MDDACKTLNEYRQAIDAFDDQLLALLAQRTAVVDKVAALKKAHWAGASFMRPGREAQILKRLLQKNAGVLPPSVIVTLWRELMMASLQSEQAFSAAVYAPPGEREYWGLARHHFGAATPLAAYDTTSAALRAVRDGAAMLAVLPVPEADSVAAPWWVQLAYQQEEAPLHIIFRLPVLSGPGAALVVGRVAPEPSGDDSSFFLLHTPQSLSREALRRTALDAGISILAAWRWYEKSSDETGIFLVECAGDIPPDASAFVPFSGRRVGLVAAPLG